MKTHEQPTISVVVPLYNERTGIRLFHDSLADVLKPLGVTYEILYVNDGSTDDTLSLLQEIAADNPSVRIITLTRNFGKEIATTAGLHEAGGKAIMTLDADGQHPVGLIPLFLQRWHEGSLVVIGRRTNRQAGFVKRVGSKLFNGIFRTFTGMKIDADSSDFRLIDQRVQAEFNRMTERNRVTRGLIEWLGYDRSYVPYDEHTRLAGDATYSFRKLVKLALDSMVSLSISPLYLVAYIGAVVLPVSALAALVMVVNFLAGDPLGLHATASAYLIVCILFLIGVLLVSQGIIGLYLSHIHTETQNRPLYVIDTDHSKGVSSNG